jgi:protoheme ferro-lyase
MMAGTRHVVLVTYGEPPTPAFVDQLVYSWRVLLGLTRTVAPIPWPLLPLIAVARAHLRRRTWTSYGYRSPLEPLTANQAERLHRALASADNPDSWQVHVAWEFRRPLLGEVLAAIPAGEPVWVAPMYAADSAFTHALSRATVAAHTAATGRTGAIHVLGALDAGVLAELSAAHVLAHTAEGRGWQGPDVALVLAAHGTVLEPSTPIDTGRVATERLCQAIATRLAGHFGKVTNGWLNHTRGGRWTEPPLEEALHQIADAGFARVVYFPYGFLADNAESELEGRIVLERHDAIEALHLPCLNASPALAAVLAEQITRLAARSAAEKRGLTSPATPVKCRPAANDPVWTGRAP